MIRKTNLQLLIDREYGLGKHGGKAEFARRMGKQADYISRCLYAPDKPGAKNVGEGFARDIEREFGLEEYAFDRSGLGGATPVVQDVSKGRSQMSGTSFSAPAVVRLIATAIAAGRLKEDDIEAIKRMTLHLIQKNEHSEPGVTAVPEKLGPLSDQISLGTENNENVDDMLKMLEHGLNKSRPMDSAKPDESTKKKRSN